MKAIRIHGYGDANTLQLEDIPRLDIADDQILVRIRDAGVNPIDWKIRQGYLKNAMPARFPLTMGQDFAGEVAETGNNARHFAVGDRVFGSHKAPMPNTRRLPFPPWHQYPSPWTLPPQPHSRPQA